jgi:hypothetical protein
MVVLFYYYYALPARIVNNVRITDILFFSKKSTL